MNEKLTQLVLSLKQLSNDQEVRIWHRIAKDLGKSTRQRREVNVSRINSNTKDGDTIIVPGKVLSLGELDHKVNVAAWSFSQAAMEKINSKGTPKKCFFKLFKVPSRKVLAVIK